MHDDGADGASLTAAPDRVLHSDPHDFAGLYIRHRASFTLHARHYLRDARDADEVVQEAFLRLFLALPELETELQALAYCRRTITNLCIDRYRAQARRPHLVDIASVPLEELADDEPLDPVVRAEDAALVRSALSMLSPLHRAALVKREIEEKSLPVIAEELEVPEDSVKHLLFRARRALRRLLAGTSLAPGGDGEHGHGLADGVRAGSGGLAALLLLLVLGLGSGPDLEALPVVGVDLPDIIGAGKVAEAVGAAVTDLVETVTPGTGPSTPDGTEPGAPAGPDGGLAPLEAVDPSPTRRPAASPAPPTPTDLPSAAPLPAAEPLPTAEPVPAEEPVAAEEPVPAAEPVPVLPPDPPLPDSPAPSPDPTPTGTPDATTLPSPEPIPAPSGPGEVLPSPTDLEPAPASPSSGDTPASTEPLPQGAELPDGELPSPGLVLETAPPSSDPVPAATP